MISFMHTMRTLAVVAASTSITCFAADALTPAQLKELYGGGKTIEATAVQSGVSFSNYLSPDGRIVQVTKSGQTKKGTWRVDDSGTHCVQWHGENELCHKVIAQGDGTYKRFDGDKHVVTIHKFMKGNPLNLEP